MKQPSKLNLVLDTNVLLVSISSYSSYHWLYQALLQNKFNVFITLEILTEYEEVISSKLSPQAGKNLVRTLIELRNVYQSNIHYKYQLIHQDPDDDKFVNCAISSGAHYIVTHDKHFDVLAAIDFPKINVIKLPELFEILFRSKL